MWQKFLDWQASLSWSPALASIITLWLIVTVAYLLVRRVYRSNPRKRR